MTNPKIAFIGGGNMAEGIVRGMIGDDRFNARQVHVYDINPQRVEYLQKEYGIIGEVSMQNAVKNADIVIFAVRPQEAHTVGVQLKDFMPKNCIFVSICASVSIATLEQMLGRSSKIVRIMPNTLTQAHYGYSSLCRNANTTAEEAKTVIEIMEAIGRVMEIPEDMFDAFTAYSCAGPAYLLYIMRSMIDAGVHAGFSRQQARSITIENMIGTAIKLNQTDMHPYEILDTMTSPGGVGIEAIYTMEQEGIGGSIMRSFQEAARRVKELS
ncbi:pyrroline-5-carboxylate reductase [Clostridium aminobutyricum]|uniref:Pyrroline-5-carboxylate reductase n=1 Tax=Clostridium aminobutyricum TaxID=33953 RepID=A0A939IK06_CLOAM|nr:pyrroline-5-carboxylate reductase [Clostridium aminobutyricum]MBN7774104.1 pyrroline-5-carboxylate reductase [Clostridium aminobutyricum]